MKYALITGASRGLGKAIALRLAKDGFAVIINYQSNREAAEDTLKQVTENGGTGELLPFDVSDPKAIEAALESWSNAHPDDYISVLVNNAGIRQDNLMVFMQEEQWNRVLDTTLNGFFFITRRLLKDMMTHRNGRIINMASLSGLKGMPGQANYSAAKAALIGATKALAQEVAARKVTVNAIAPGFISTDMTKELNEAELKKLVPLGIPLSSVGLISSADFMGSYPDIDPITGETVLKDKFFKTEADMNELDNKLKLVTQKQSVDISGIREIISVEPLIELSDLTFLDISETSVEDITPLRSVNKLKVLRANSSFIEDISSLRYCITLDH